jgi:predicted transcriptional regulator
MDEVFIFFRRPFVLIMLSLLKSETNKSKLTKDANLSYSHTLKILDILNDIGIIETMNHGRSDIIRLTEDGTEIAEIVKEIVEKLTIKRGLK